jgi:predicted nucleotidyltransferase
MPKESIQAALFLQKDKIIRMGLPPVRIEILTGISGVIFEECFEHKEPVEIDGIAVPFISLRDLKKNKAAAGRHKDLEDLKHLP